jgi:ABC-2 type transport system permease protein
MENTNSLKVVNVRGWRMGFANLFKVANGSFWHTRSWIVQTLLWLLLLNGTIASVLWTTTEILDRRAYPDNLTSMQIIGKDPVGNALIIFFVFASLGLPVSAIIKGQDAINNERKSGTAAWVLSKPVSRPAFILSKMFAGALSVFITGVVIQGVFVYTQLSVWTGSPWPVAGFLGAMGLIFLNYMFYLTLTYMLGSFFTSQGPVLGISLGLSLIGPSFVRGLPVINDITPWSFFLPISEDIPPGIAMFLGQPTSLIIPIIGTLLMCVVFTAIAILRFRREEF